MRVSILILVDQSLEQVEVDGFLNADDVSILILVDQSLEPNFFISHSYAPLCFNPYSSGSVIGTYPNDLFDCAIIVSILILVDQSLEHIQNCSNTLFYISFNPYSSGSVIGTRGAWSRSERRGSVSILILVDQSLELHHTQAAKLDLHVSILILVDQSLEHLKSCPGPLYQICFNPYSSGSVIGTQNQQARSFYTFCFNPYSSGSVIGTYLIGGADNEKLPFQSLF